MSAGSEDGGAGAATAPALSFSGVTFRYREDAPPAVSTLDLSLLPGELMAVVGGNGSGKSTVARLANGLLVPQEGVVTVGRLDTVDHESRWEIHARVGLLFQDSDDQIVGATVEDDVAFGPENLGMPREEMRRRVPDAIGVVGLSGEETTEPHLLSGGQKQRLALAGVLALRPSVLVLDEPTSMLDPAGRAAVLTQMRGLTEQGVAVMLITQHMDEALVADRLLALDGGRLVFVGAPAEFFGSRAGAALPLSDPPVYVLASELESELGHGALGAPLPLKSEELLSALRRLQRGGYSSEQVVAPPRVTARDRAAQRVTARLPAAVELRDVAYTYNRGTPFARSALEGVSLSLAEGAVTAVIGATASGKSTLLQLAAGLLSPTKGQVLFSGRQRPSRGAVGMAFQRAEVQLFAGTVEADVAFAPKLQGVEGAALSDRVAWALETVGLDPGGFSARMPHSLSVGEQRRVALAGVLSLDPLLLVLDEPTAGLDPRGRRLLMERLVAWSRGDGPPYESASDGGPRSLVFTSHDMDEVAVWADHVVLLGRGRLLSAGPADAVLGDLDSLAAAGLRPPLAAAIADRMSDDAAGFASDVRTLPIDARALAVWLTERAEWSRQRPTCGDPK